jgi:protocatechuate 3,4-dioxygenase beta subunit
MLKMLGATGIIAVTGSATRILAQGGEVATVTPIPTTTAITSLAEGEPYPYLSGGTAGMSGNYPNPFLNYNTDVEITCSQTLGPCYADVNLVRQDVTEGLVGLPMRLMFLLIDANTQQPIENASVEIWFANVDGVYSGETPSEICNAYDEDVMQQAFMRGIQYADADGIVQFDVVYPGWYSGRTPHIHVRIGLDDEELLLTQVYFPDELNAFIYPTHPDYEHRGVNDTTNETDRIADADDLSAFLLNTETMDDGALLGYLALGLRSSTDEPLCSVSGGGQPGSGQPGAGPGGPGGPGNDNNV